MTLGDMGAEVIKVEKPGTSVYDLLQPLRTINTTDEMLLK